METASKLKTYRALMALIILSLVIIATHLLVSLSGVQDANRILAIHFFKASDVGNDTDVGETKHEARTFAENGGGGESPAYHDYSSTSLQQAPPQAPLGKQGVEALVRSYAPLWLQARQTHEQLFLPVVLPGGATGMETECAPNRDRSDRSKPIVHVAIGVLSGAEPKYALRRAAWREMYMRWPERYRNHVVMRFFTALPKEETQLTELEKEAVEFGDLITLGHVDAYTNISMKSIGVFTWGSEACGAYYTVKTDDDTFVHLPRLLRSLYKTPPLNVYAGNTLDVDYFVPFRNSTNKWFLRWAEYPFRFGAPYMRGALVALSWDLANHVANVRLSPNFHWMAFEDTTIGHIVALHNPKVVQLPVSVAVGTCQDDAVAIHYVKEKKFGVLQNNALALRPLCEGYLTEI